MRITAILPLLATLSTTALATTQSGETKTLDSHPVKDLGTTNESSAAGCLITTFTGNNCDEIAGSTNPPERCLWTGLDPGPQKHSYRIGDGCGEMNVYLHSEKTCAPSDPSVHKVQGPGCYNVNLGKAWKAAWFMYN
ncbi:hypothetical protein BDW69DRAFT_183998 [Aspergillus filifer]